MPRRTSEAVISVAEAPALAVSEQAEAMAASRRLEPRRRRARRSEDGASRRRNSSRSGGPAAATSMRASRAANAGRASVVAEAADASLAACCGDRPMRTLRPAGTARAAPAASRGVAGGRRAGATTAVAPASSAPTAASAPQRQPRPDRSERPARADRAQHGTNDPAPRGRPQRGERPDRAARGDRPDRDPALRAKYIKGRGEGRDRRDRDARSEFAVRQARRAQGAARGERQGAALRRRGLGPPTHRQVALARAGGANACGGGGARCFRSRADQWPACRCAQPRGAARRRGDGRARPRGAGAQGPGLCRAPRLRRRCPRACAKTLEPRGPRASAGQDGGRAAAANGVRERRGERALAGQASSGARDERLTGDAHCLHGNTPLRPRIANSCLPGAHALLSARVRRVYE